MSAGRDIAGTDNDLTTVVIQIVGQSLKMVWHRWTDVPARYED